MPTQRHLRLALVAVGTCLAIAATPLVGQAGLTSPYVRKSLVRLAPGITWEKGKARTSSGIQTVQIGRIDVHEPTVRIRSLLSNDRVINLEPPTVNANRNSAPGAQAMIATNGDVSVAGDWGAGAHPATMHIQDGELMVGTICGRPTLGILPDGTAKVDLVKNKITIDMTSRLPDWRGMLYTAGVNKVGNTNQIIVYTDRFGPTTLTTGSKVEVDVEADGMLTSNGRMTGRVVSVTTGTNNSPIDRGHWVFSGNGNRAEPLKLLKPGDKVAVETEMVLADPANRCGPGETAPESWQHLENAMGGNYFTAYKGANIAPTYSEYSKGGVPAPRTNVGITADGDILMVVVDGRQANYSIGMNLIELGDLMMSLGAVSAFNLDGGGSTVMGIRKPADPSKLVISDRPSDGRERNLTQALAAFSVTPGD